MTFGKTNEYINGLGIKKPEVNTSGFKNELSYNSGWQKIAFILSEMLREFKIGLTIWL